MMDRRISKLPVVLMLLALVLALSVPQVSEASGTLITYTFFSDATYTEIVGGYRKECDGKVTSWGQRTNYYIYREDPCS